MANQTQHVRVPKELYHRALDVSEQYGVTIGEALNLMSQGERHAGTGLNSPGDPVAPQGDNTQGQPLSPEVTEGQPESTVEATDHEAGTKGQGGEPASEPEREPTTEGHQIVPLATADAPAVHEMVVRHHHLIEDTRDPERLERLEERTDQLEHQAEEQQQVSALLGAGYAAHDATIKDHLGQHAEGRRKFDTGQSLEAGEAAARDFLETLGVMRDRRSAAQLERAYLKRLPPALRERIKAEPDHDAAA